jgi:tetratricopeptide (TPR) repeat protein
LHYDTSDADADAGFAHDWSLKAIKQTEQSLENPDLEHVEQHDLSAVTLLAAEWDTLGWVYFHQNDLSMAEKYVNAAWQLNQHASLADHLGQIYSKQGKKAEAVHAWRLALAANSKDTEVAEHLRSAGYQMILAEGTKAAEELGQLRTIKLPSLPKQTGSAEFFLLISKNGIESAQMIGESLAFNDAASAIQSAKYDFPFPDAGPEKLIRRGILSCSIYTTPSC